MKTSQQTIVIGNHAVDLSREALIDPNGSIVPLRPRAWMVLRFLALRAGRLVGKAELMDEVWADCEVTEDSLVQAVGDVRRALGEAGRTALRTLPRRGYMLIANDSRPGTAPQKNRHSPLVDKGKSGTSWQHYNPFASGTGFGAIAGKAAWPGDRAT